MNVNDRVYHKILGYGTIKGFFPGSTKSVAVEFDDMSLKGHTCEGLVPRGNGWYVKESSLKLEGSYTKQDLIIKKIKYLQKKFDERKIYHAYPF
jgi:hypothetical protein